MKEEIHALKIRLTLRAVVVRQLQHRAEHLLDELVSLAGGLVPLGQGRDLLRGEMRQEVQRKAPIRARAVVALPDLRHAQLVAVEAKRLDGVFHSHHGLCEGVLVGHSRLSRSRHNLNPVAIGIQRKRQAFHATLIRSLLETNTCSL